jgi:hypothetical protein
MREGREKRKKKVTSGESMRCDGLDLGRAKKSRHSIWVAGFPIDDDEVQLVVVSDFLNASLGSKRFCSQNKQKIITS